MTHKAKTAAVIGAGPAGLMAAEVLSAAGWKVVVFDRMPSVGRKFLMAGRGGLNLTHSEDLSVFTDRYGEAAERLAPILAAFPPQALIAWAEGLGQSTFVGSSGRVFPKALKASPLLRAWLARLADLGVEIRTRRDWTGWDVDGALTFQDEAGLADSFMAEATVLALGGASWAKLGSNGAWADILRARGVEVAPFQPANGGFRIDWSEVFRSRFAGSPLKNVALSFEDRRLRGEAMIAGYGIEGGAIYALSADLREAIGRSGAARLEIDLRPDQGAAHLAARLDWPHDGQSLANVLRKALKLSPLEVNLLREGYRGELPAAPAALAAAIKAVPLTLVAPQGIERAISSAGGIALSEVDETLMLRALPGVHAVGEMLAWEAPTGGYLLQACFATGVAAARAILARD